MSASARLGFVAAFALAAIVALEWALRQDELRQSEASAAENESRRAWTEQGSARPLSFASVTAHAVVLCDRPGSVPEAAGEWQILADGRLLLRRSPPLPTSPGSTEVQVFAVALPVRELASLDARARAALLDFLSVAWSERPVAAERLLLQGIAGTDADRAALLSWLR